jgi:hypothetical protein
VSHGGKHWVPRADNPVANGSGFAMNDDWYRYQLEIAERLGGINGPEVAKELKASTYNLPDYAALRAYTGNKEIIYITKDGIAGDFKYDPTDTTSADNGGTIIVTASSRRYRRIYDKEISVKWFGVVGNANIRFNNQFYADSAHTVVATDDTTAMQNAMSLLNNNRGEVVTGIGKAITLDLCGLSIKVSSALHIQQSLTRMVNGVICQSTENQDCLIFDGATPMTPLIGINLNKISFMHAYTTAVSGCLIRSKRLLGFFKWDSNNALCWGGYRGFMHDTGSIFMSKISNVWMNNLYGSGFYMPANGDPISLGATIGGSTTTILENCFVSDVQTAEPGFDIGNLFNTVILNGCAADKVSSFGRFNTIQMTMAQCSSESIRPPIVGSLPNPHYIIDIAQSYGATIDGFALAVEPGFPVISGNHAFISSTVTPLKVSGISGEVPNNNYAPLYINGGICDGTAQLFNAKPNIVLNGGRIIPAGGEMVLNTEYTAGLTGAVIFTAPAIPVQTSKKYLVEFTYNFNSNFVAPVWLVVMNGVKQKITLLSDGPDFLGDMALTISGLNISLKSNAQGLTGPVTITELGAWTK